MIWITINIILLIVGIGLIAASGYLNKEGIDDILECLLCCAGAVCLAFLIVSEPLRWWLG